MPIQQKILNEIKFWKNLSDFSLKCMQHSQEKEDYDSWYTANSNYERCSAILKVLERLLK
jgi:hypothetical protein